MITADTLVLILLLSPVIYAWWRDRGRYRDRSADALYQFQSFLDRD